MIPAEWTAVTLCSAQNPTPPVSETPWPRRSPLRQMERVRCMRRTTGPARLER